MFQQMADRLQLMAGGVARSLTAARQRPSSAAQLARLGLRARRFHTLALDYRAAEIAERARCGPGDSALVSSASSSAQRLAQRGVPRHQQPRLGLHGATGWQLGLWLARRRSR